MTLNLEIAVTDAEEFADLWDILDEMITDGDVPQHYRTRLTAIRRAIDKQETIRQWRCWKRRRFSTEISTALPLTDCWNCSILLKISKKSTVSI